MATIKLSKEAALKAQRISQDTYNELVQNVNILRKEIEMQYQNLNDKATTKKLAEMFQIIENLLSKLANNFDDINDYCDKTIRWIDEWNNK